MVLRHFSPGSRTVFAVAPILFYIPIMGWVAKQLGLIPASNQMIMKALTLTSVIIVVGGVPELVGQEQRQLYIDKRFGFARIAVECKVPIVAVWVNGEFDTFSLLPLPFLNWRMDLSNKLGFAIIFPWVFGWRGLWLPRRVPLAVLMSEPLFVRDTGETVQQFKLRYMSALDALMRLSASSICIDEGSKCD
jgi:1-acyl-sn-glycerol-3-phosphate acyltransferase